MAFSILNIAYPFAPIGPNAVGGAEQVVAQLDGALVRAGHESVVMACDGSTAEGTLLPAPKFDGLLGELERAVIYEHHRFFLKELLEEWPIDLIHMHGVDFFEYLPPSGVPVLVTL